MRYPLLTDYTVNTVVSRRWLMVGIWAVAIAGIFSLVLVVARTPQLSEIALFKKLFHESLVVHVDLSVLVWFVAIAGMCWSLAGGGRISGSTSLPYVQGASWGCFAAGMVLIALSPFDQTGGPLMSNYIPVITNPVFFFGLALLLCGVVFAIWLFCAAPAPEGFSFKDVFSARATSFHALYFGVLSSVVITALALMAFFWSYRLIPAGISGQEFYEMTFWAGGHLLQFTHTQIVMIAWLALATACGLELKLAPRLLAILFAIGLLAALISPVGFMHPVTSYEHSSFFTHLMNSANGIAPTVVAAVILWALWQSRRQWKGNRVFVACLLASLGLFLFGGVLGLMIRGQNVTIPAHYHGSIVGITIAFMGFAYVLLPAFGYKSVAGMRMAFIQPILYGIGQMMHISGLAWSGGYGVLRKTPGALDAGMTGAKVAMGFMGMGGLLAIIGGLLFVIVVWRSVRGKTALC